MRLSLIMFLWLFSACAATANGLDYADFSTLPIQHEGRIKPLSTFALIHLEKFHDASRLGEESATAWLAEVMFNPAKAMQRPLFAVKDADVVSMLGMAEKPDHFYSFAEVADALAQHHDQVASLLQHTTEQLSLSQRGVVELYRNAGLFAQITLSYTLLLPLSIDIPNHTGTAFIDDYAQLPELQKSLRALVASKGKNPQNYSATEKQLAQAVETLTLTLEHGRENTLLRVIPPQWGARDEWLTPWMVFHSGQGSPQTAEALNLWRNLATAYQAQEVKKWQKTTASLAHSTQDLPDVRPSALKLERFYYASHPLATSTLLYMAGLAFTLLGLSGVRSWRKPAMRRLIIALAASGAALHFIAIAARIYILERPPVGTLYESLLFVSLIAVLFGLLIEFRLRNSLGLLVSCLLGSLLLFASQSFSGEDTMGMLIAVLNTNFWLATHVLCITTGYGFGLVAGIIAHCYLIMRCLRRDADATRQVLRGAYGTALIALLFTALGTILGGIWADQSWGRFWGWDPKENGALMICLWLIWLLHGRIGGQMQERGFAVGLALLNVVIALSWLGVNLLATGLHSYGFTDKAAWSLAAFCAAEINFALITTIILWRREHAQAL